VGNDCGQKKGERQKEKKVRNEVSQAYREKSRSPSIMKTGAWKKQCHAKKSGKEY